MFFGLTPAQVKQCAYTYDITNNLRTPFQADNKAAGHDWLIGFIKRNPQIGLRKPEITSLNRVTAFNNEEVHILQKSK
ncbi:hypothetical protein JTB14_008876 [Gonioctena quinquepunctata]|nr:hypothetical protein JTB14_008876 [Gonioctena quinquepunctata]